MSSVMHKSYSNQQIDSFLQRLHLIRNSSAHRKKYSPAEIQYVSQRVGSSASFISTQIIKAVVKEMSATKHESKHTASPPRTQNEPAPPARERKSSRSLMLALSGLTLGIMVLVSMSVVVWYSDVLRHLDRGRHHDVEAEISAYTRYIRFAAVFVAVVLSFVLYTIK
uniref:AlNc14C6G805 protein n=1 Tax=Albugo laibachii Nc14 TaxID=890382 RepID=F0W126_9STRA|nr:AlNc14C6G805 [Albugo laibachii Nc14]|eukprot:CCA14750.1 AlNc14C6G805 [Albugo laibachii Nc14]